MSQATCSEAPPLGAASIVRLRDRESRRGPRKRCPRRCSLIRRRTSTRSGSAFTAPSDIPVTVNMGPVDEKDVPAVVAGYDTVINDATYFSAATLEKCTGPEAHRLPRHRRGELRRPCRRPKLGIKVSTISGYGDTTVAEHAMGLVFAAARHIATMHGIVRGGGWRPMQGMELRGKTLGIVGLGGIGARDGAARQRHRAECAGLQPHRQARARCRSTNCWRKSDIVSLHLGLNDQTRGFLSRERLGKTKPGVIIVNTARAGVVDEAALIDGAEVRPCRPLRHRRVRQGAAVAGRAAAARPTTSR